MEACGYHKIRKIHSATEVLWGYHASEYGVKGCMLVNIWLKGCIGACPAEILVISIHMPFWLVKWWPEAIRKWETAIRLQRYYGDTILMNFDDTECTLGIINQHCSMLSWNTRQVHATSFLWLKWWPRPADIRKSECRFDILGMFTPPLFVIELAVCGYQKIRISC